MGEDFVKRAHDEFSLFDFLSKSKNKNSAVIVVTPHQLINCKTMRNGEGNHSPMFSYIADRILPGKIEEYLDSRGDVIPEIAVLIAGKILNDECVKCKLSNEHLGGILGWTFPKSGTLSTTQFELLEKYLNDNRNTIERTESKMGIIGEGDAVTINEFIERARKIVDPQKEVPELYANEEIIGITQEKDDRIHSEDEQK